MERFYSTKRVLANGTEWCSLLENGGVKGDTDAGVNYFSRKSLRDAWAEMENHFCAETVMALISEIDQIYGDEFVPTVEIEEINRVVVSYKLKGSTWYSSDVEYVFCGDSATQKLLYEG